VAPQDFALHVPKGSGADLAEAIERVPAAHRTSWRMHKVQAGETLTSIGKPFGVAAASLIAINHVTGGEAAEGDWIVIPAAPQPAPRRTYSPARRTAAAHPVSPSHAASHAASSAQPAVKKPVIVAHAATR
jgi:hypothetical protein